MGKSFFKRTLRWGDFNSLSFKFTWLIIHFEVILLIRVVIRVMIRVVIRVIGVVEEWIGGLKVAGRSAYIRGADSWTGPNTADNPWFWKVRWGACVFWKTHGCFVHDIGDPCYTECGPLFGVLVCWVWVFVVVPLAGERCVCYRDSSSSSRNRKRNRKRNKKGKRTKRQTKLASFLVVLLSKLHCLLLLFLLFLLLLLLFFLLSKLKLAAIFTRWTFKSILILEALFFFTFARFSYKSVKFPPALG